MKTHILKLNKDYVDLVMLNIKKFELRKNDRDYQIDDKIHFVDVDGNDFNNHFRTQDSTNLFVITYILQDVPEYGLDEDFCILGIERVY